VAVTLRNDVEGLERDQHSICTCGLSSLLPYKIDYILYSLLQARHAQFPYLELHGLLRQHLTCKLHDRQSIRTLGWLLQELIVKCLQMGCCQKGSFCPLFEVDDMLCHVVEPNKVMVAIVAFRTDSKVKSCLKPNVSVCISIYQ